jgi:hypothetical protein
MKPEYAEDNPVTLKEYQHLWLTFTSIKGFCKILQDVKQKYIHYPVTLLVDILSLFHFLNTLCTRFYK